MQESTRLEDDHFELEGQIWGSSHLGFLRLFQEEPYMENGALKLSPEAQLHLLQWLYERRYPLYIATTLSLGGDDIPEWIASGKAGNVIRTVDASPDEYQYPEQQSIGQLLHESGENPDLFLDPDPELP